jgi:hypothetical protein
VRRMRQETAIWLELGALGSLLFGDANQPHPSHCGSPPPVSTAVPDWGVIVEQGRAGALLLPPRGTVGWFP